jgi:hypothetical protein
MANPPVRCGSRTHGGAFPTKHSGDEAGAHEGARLNGARHTPSQLDGRYPSVGGLTLQRRPCPSAILYNGHAGLGASVYQHNRTNLD